MGQGRRVWCGVSRKEEGNIIKKRTVMERSKKGYEEKGRTKMEVKKKKPKREMKGMEGKTGREVKGR